MSPVHKKILYLSHFLEKEQKYINIYIKKFTCCSEHKKKIKFCVHIRNKITPSGRVAMKKQKKKTKNIVQEKKTS